MHLSQRAAKKFLAIKRVGRQRFVSFVRRYTCLMKAMRRQKLAPSFQRRLIALRRQFIFRFNDRAERLPQVFQVQVVRVKVD